MLFPANIFKKTKKSNKIINKENTTDPGWYKYIDNKGNNTPATQNKLKELNYPNSVAF